MSQQIEKPRSVCYDLTCVCLFGLLDGMIYKTIEYTITSKSLDVYSFLNILSGSIGIDKINTFTVQSTLDRKKLNQNLSLAHSHLVYVCLLRSN